MPKTEIANIVKGMRKGTRTDLYNQSVTRDSTFVMDVVLSWHSDYDEPLVVMTTLNDTRYFKGGHAVRTAIRQIHKDWKSNAFDIGKSRITNPKRIETLLIPIAFAYVLCVFEEKRED